MSSNPIRWVSFDAATDVSLCWFVDVAALQQELCRAGGWADVATRRGIIEGFKRRAQNLMSLLVVVEASEITTTGLKCLLRSHFSPLQLQGLTRQSLMEAFLAERAEKGPTLSEVDMSFRLQSLPAELQTKIAEFAVYEDRVIGLGNCKKAPFRYMTTLQVPPIAQASKAFRQIGLKAYYNVNTFGTEIRGRDRKQIEDVQSLVKSLGCLPEAFTKWNLWTTPTSLDLRHVQIHLPSQVVLTANVTKSLSVALSLREFLEEVIKSEASNFDHGFLHTRCFVDLVDFRHTHVFTTNQWSTRQISTSVRLHEMRRRTLRVSELIDFLTQ
ncbi:hypothetical protein KC333_g6739 [Hortaea werneckii]|nr:hypothetical protein KC333_g6739 [Hortaea werneckii]KAI7310538.1 hypothetical protein KC326_g6642 [Hortaea werneckii]